MSSNAVACPPPFDISSWIRRRDPGLLALLLLPLAFTALDRNWLFSDRSIDSWGYFGYYLNLTNYLKTFDGTYYVTRLSAILPGWLAYALFPPLYANCLLHLAHYYACVISLYFVLRASVHRRTAFLAALAMGCDPWFIQTMGSDYVVSSGITYYLLTMLFLTLATQLTGWRQHLIVAGTSAAALVIANSMFLIFLPFLIAYYLLLNHERLRHPWLIGFVFIGLGFIGLLLALGVLNHSITGRFWFLLPSISSYSPSPKTYQLPNPFKDPTWLLTANWLLYPMLASLGALIWLIRRVFGFREHGSRVIIFYQLQLILLLTVLAVLDTPWHIPLVRIPYYVCALLPIVFLALGGQLDRLMIQLRPAQVRLVSAVAAISLIGAAFIPRIEPTPHYPRLFPLGAFLLTGALAGAVVLLLDWRRVSGRLSLCIFVLLGGSVYLNRVNYPGPFESESERLIDRNRPAVLRAVVDGVRAVQAVNPNGRVWAWYDQHAPLAYLYLMLSCAHQSGLILPDIQLMDILPVSTPGRLRPGTKVVVLSSGDDILAQTTDTLQRHGVDVRILSETAINKGPFTFTLTMIETVDANRVDVGREQATR